MKSQQMMTCNFCNGQGWINAHEACPICVGSGVVPMMNMPAVRQQQKPAKPKQQQPKQQQPPARQQQPPARQQQPVYQQQTPPVYQQPQPVYQQQPQPVYQQQQTPELHIFVHDQFRQQPQPQQYQQFADIPTPQPAKSGGVSLFQIACVIVIIAALMTWGGAL